ncbi:predicted protein [Cyanophage PSS2]|uniref:ORF020 Staphylococcus phi-Twort-like protein n=1 Tax=Cyanophage PSS2 TaxID=658401 RepID=UPI0001B03FDD|nr:ORF020 Staphylococcus phi-Twort-like protein [Cyanophage PSS2]ACT65569.1 ORF020 Staphylococcus phi-Twort-like protein [Cyanophage PSS2]ACY75713.1 predicted protein [Cyanophage PSS2]
MTENPFIETLNKGTSAKAPSYSAAQLKHVPQPKMSMAARDEHDRQLTRDARKAARQAASDEATVAEWRHYLDNFAAVADEVRNAVNSRTPRSARVIRGGTLLAQVTDVHFGGTVKRDKNHYSLDTASRRLAAYAEEILALQAQTGASDLGICLTGDIFDSYIGKMRTDKILHAEGPAVWSFAMGLELIKQFVTELAESEAFGSVTLYGICGNEARLMNERGHGELVATDNWDSLLNGQLAVHFGPTDVECNFAVNRLVVEAEGWRVLLMHGDQGLSAQCTQKECQSILGLHNADFGMSGHIHNPLVSGHWIRSGSLIGTDSYAGEGLNLSGYASQSVVHLTPQRRNVHVIDLQYCDNVEPYTVVDFGGAFGIAGL